jgi:hypothetical protein
MVTNRTKSSSPVAFISYQNPSVITAYRDRYENRFHEANKRRARFETESGFADKTKTHLREGNEQ